MREPAGERVALAWMVAAEQVPVVGELGNGRMAKLRLFADDEAASLQIAHHLSLIHI